jgi:hypothetical protein
MKILLMAAVMFMGPYSFANFSGIWQGEGTVTLKDGRKVYCDEIILNVTQSKDKLSFGKFSYGCDELGFNFTPPELKVVDGTVIYKDQNSGTITDTNAHLHFILANNGSSRYTAEMVSANEMNYLDEQIDTDPTTGVAKITAVQAKLFKK